MTERRYSGPEIEEIFERATRTSETPSRELADRDGLTLSQLQEIGREVGVSPERVSAAAGALDRRAGYQRTLGLPLGVAHRVPLPRDLTEPEWQRLVADLRATFQATGRVREEAGLRRWTNGNLHASVEPTGEGHQLRMGTTRGMARQLLGTGGGMMGLALLLGLLWILGVDADFGQAAVIVFSFGLAAAGAGAVPLPAWASKRREQMEGVADRLLGAIDG